MKILHTDNDTTPATELPIDEFLQKNAAINSAQNARDAVIDLSTGQPELPAAPDKKKNNKAIWAIIILVVLLIVAGLVFYFQLKAKKENEHIGS